MILDKHSFPDSTLLSLFFSPTTQCFFDEYYSYFKSVQLQCLPSFLWSMPVLSLEDVRRFPTTTLSPISDFFLKKNKLMTSILKRNAISLLQRPFFNGRCSQTLLHHRHKRHPEKGRRKGLKTYVKSVFYCSVFMNGWVKQKYFRCCLLWEQFSFSSVFVSWYFRFRHNIIRCCGGTETLFLFFNIML